MPEGVKRTTADLTSPEDARRAGRGRRPRLAPARREPVTGWAFVELVYREAGRPPRFSSTSPAAVRVAGLFVPLIREVGDVMYQWTGPFVSDWSRFRNAFGPFEPTPHREAVRRTLAWFAERRAK